MYHRVAQDGRRLPASRKNNRPSRKPSKTSSSVELTRLPLRHPAPTNPHVATSLPLDCKRQWSKVAVGMIFVLLPAPFLVLCFMALNLDRQTLSSTGAMIISFSRVSPTIYPIVFAGIVARLFQNLARWRAEKGISLGHLEFIIRSQSLAGSIQTSWSLRLFSLVNIVILIVWALSPLGGQSSLRVLSNDTMHDSTSVNITIANYDFFRYFGGLSRPTTAPLAIEGIMRAALLTSTSASSPFVDDWGHVKVPAVVSTIDETQADGHWHDVKDAIPTPFSALVGIPMYNIPSVGQFTFTIPWTFMLWDNCSSHSLTQKDYCAMRGQNSMYMYNPTTGNGTCNGAEIIDDILIHDWNGAHLPLDGGPPTWTTMRYAVAPYSTNLSVSFSCTLSSVRRDLLVGCSDGNCAVEKVRRSTIDTRPPWVTLFNQWRGPSTSRNIGPELDVGIDMFLRSTGTTDKMGGPEFLTPLENFLAGSASPFHDYNHRLRKTTSEVFGRQMTLAWNTFWLAAMFYTNTVNDIHVPWNSTNSGTLPSVSNFSTATSLTDFKYTTGTLQTPVSIYKADRVWIFTLLSVTLFLQACAVLSLVLTLITKAPDIIGWTSSLTRESSHFVHHQGSCDSTMDGNERTRLLKRLTVRVADVQPDRAIGHIAFTCDGEELETYQGRSRQRQMRLRADRLYD